METDLPWQFFQAATFVSSGTFKKERPAEINKHTQGRYIFELIFFCCDWRSNIKTTSVSFLEGKFPSQIFWPLNRSRSSMALTFEAAAAAADADEQRDPLREAMSQATSVRWLM